MPSWCFKGTVLLTHRIVAAPLTGGSNSSNGKSTSTGFSGTTKSYYNEINQKAKNSAAIIAKQTNKQIAAEANPSEWEWNKNEGESIVISGEKRSSKFKYNFIESGIKGIKNYQAAGITDITWIVFTYGYSSSDLDHFQQTADELGAKFISVDNNQQFINYLNTGDTNNTNGSRDQKITNMVVYGHGKPGVMMLGEKDISTGYLKKQLRGAAFDNTKTVLYTCRGANQDAKNYSVAQVISDITQGETNAMYGRVDYSYISYSKELTKTTLILEGLAAMGDNDPSSKTLRLKILSNHVNEYMEQSAMINKLREETGYIQEGAFYDPIPGKQAWNLPEFLRPPSYWMSFQPIEE